MRGGVLVGGGLGLLGVFVTVDVRPLTLTHRAGTKGRGEGMGYGGGQDGIEFFAGFAQGDGAVALHVMCADQDVIG